MRIEILDLSPAMETGKGPLVAFRSLSGQAWARWRGSELPQVGALVDVEVDVPDEIARWAIVDGPATMASDTPRSPVRIRGVVATVDEDAVVAIRVGADIILVELARPIDSVQPGQVDKPRVGAAIEFTTPEIDIYPYSV
ncbi:hypothetical protein C3492_30305 [Streptomyces sp. Ru62]|uniref:hypothetical protein n=1 Tax=Streptomyces sp. Ru62 TaxID=2080745 RepID=UPI000CDD3A07|nr:hypothetical protein [Streptomyces sp. Ru62]POX59843.1 hypothetical protein C3492_30305 [Streptomyces sp. Ru62]